ncbi:MAG: formate/nitrite transporter family protein [Anderseniella sp.]|nr:formate/nitrite transporter family protein [Anderseniella sp.]
MSKEPVASEEIDLDQAEEQEAREREALRAPVIYEIIRREGEEELSRPAFSLAVSGLAAGIAIGFSVVSEAILHAYLPDAPWRHLVESFGYTVGFLIIIMARLQLFTENTITPVLPVLLNPTGASIMRTARLWGIVLTANMVGCFIFALLLITPGAIPPEVYRGALSISHHMMENDRWEMLIRGVFSGWLIASLVWMMPTAENAKFWVIILITYLIAAGNFTHIVAGSVEAFLLVLVGDLSLLAMATDFFIPVLVGNVVGGTCLFAILSYGQISHEI